MATLDELIGSWALSVRPANRSPRTVAQYVDESLAQFRRWMAEHEPAVAPGRMTGNTSSATWLTSPRPVRVDRPDPLQGASAVLRLVRRTRASTRAAPHLRPRLARPSPPGSVRFWL